MIGLLAANPAETAGWVLVIGFGISCALWEARNQYEQWRRR